ncbi:helix-turn-helix domain-containing protein [Micromonospora chokoriensis]
MNGKERATSGNGPLLAPLVHRFPAAGVLLGGLTRRTIFTLVEQGELETVLIGQTRMIPHSSIEAYIERQKAKARVARSADASVPAA